MPRPAAHPKASRTGPSTRPVGRRGVRRLALHCRRRLRRDKRPLADPAKEV